MEKLSVSFRKSYQSQDYVRLEKCVSQGRFSVFQCDSPTRRSRYAVKFFPKDSVSKAHYQREKHVLSKLDHPHVIKYDPILGHERSTHFDMIFTSFAPHGNFMSLTEDNIFKGQEILVRTYFRQLIEGIEYIHSKKVAHLDLKLENLLIGEDFLLKIVDFDLAQEVGETVLISGGTRDYRAPEIIERFCKDFFAADIYSAGIILYVLMTGEFPFLETVVDGLSKTLHYDTFVHQNSEFWRNKAEKMGNKNYFSEDLKKLLNGMLNPKSKERWNILDVRYSSWYYGPVFDPWALRYEMGKTLDKLNRSKNPLNKSAVFCQPNETTKVTVDKLPFYPANLKTRLQKDIIW